MKNVCMFALSMFQFAGVIIFNLKISSDFLWFSPLIGRNIDTQECRCDFLNMDELIACTKCKKDLPIDKFYKRSGKRCYLCIDCEREYAYHFRDRRRNNRIINSIVSDIEGEIWKTVSNSNGRYMVSNFGRIKSVYMVHETMCVIQDELLKTNLSSCGYLRATLIINNKASQSLIHRIVAMEFISKIEGKPFINHKNAIKTDNRILNLEWCTQKENVRHAFSMGLVMRKGEHGRHKLSNSEVMEILNSTENSSIICLKYGVKRQTIDSIRSGKNWSHLTGLCNGTA